MGINHDHGGWTGGNAAGEGGVVMDVEFEQVEDGVGDEGNRAVQLYLDTVL